MDLELVLLMVAAVVGIVVGTAHMLGYVPPRYRRMLAEVQQTTAQALTDAIRGSLRDLLPEDDPEGVSPLDSLPARLESLQEAITHVPQSIGAEVRAAVPPFPDLSAFPEAVKIAVRDGLVEAQKEILAGLPAELTEPTQQAGLAFGTDAAADKKLTRGLKAAVGADALGPYGAILEQFAPTTFAWLQEHPSEIIWALQQPWVQSIIKRGAELLGNVTQGRTGGVEEVLGRVVR